MVIFPEDPIYFHMSAYLTFSYKSVQKKKSVTFFM